MKILLLCVGLLSLALLAASISYDLTLVVDNTGTFRGEASVTVPFPGTSLVFRLYPNHFGHFVQVEEVRFSGNPLPWDLRDPTLVFVPLPQNLPQTVSVQVRFSGTLPETFWGYGTFARTSSTMTLSQAYPVLAPKDTTWLHPTFPFGDNLVAEVADYILDLRVPTDWIPVASGEEEELEPDHWRIRGENLRELGLVLVYGYQVVEEKWDGLSLRIFAPPELHLARRRALSVAKESLTVFTSKLGPFPYPSLDMVVVPLVGAGGVEFPGLILMAQEYAQDPHSDFFAEIVAHELAHQWWYGEVGTDQVGEPWVDEGLATFTSALLFESLGKLEEKVREWNERYSRAQSLNPKATVASPLWEFPGGLGYSGYVYAGGALFFAELRRALGDAEFFRALRLFREKFRWQLARGCDLIKIFLEIGGETVWNTVEKYLGRSRRCWEGGGQRPPSGPAGGA